MSNTNIAVVKLLYDAFSRGDIDTVLAAVAPNVELHSGGEKQDYPLFGPHKGIADVDVCPTCGQNIDKRDPRAIEYHKQQRHLPYSGKRKGGWR